MTKLTLLVALAPMLLAGLALPADAKNHDPASHRHSYSTIDPHCAIPAFAKRHPDKCAGYPTTSIKGQ